jgi:hypothetical protein
MVYGGHLVNLSRLYQVVQVPRCLFASASVMAARLMKESFCVLLNPFLDYWLAMHTPLGLFGPFVRARHASHTHLFGFEKPVK